MGVNAVTGIDFRNGMQRRYIGLPLNLDGYEEMKTRHLSLYLEDEWPFLKRRRRLPNVLVILSFNPGKVFSLRENEYIGVTAQHELNRLLFSPGRISAINW